MSVFPIPEFLGGYWQNAFHLKQHLADFAELDYDAIDIKLAAGQKNLAEIGRRDFDWEKATDFYREKVGEAYLFELGAWHLSSQDYIGQTLLLIAAQAQGRVLDFGGGIGTHTIGAALSPQVEKVIYCDINPVSLKFVKQRVSLLGLEEKVVCCDELPSSESFDTIICFDVVEHLPDPSQQLLEFHKKLSPEGKIILNWYFFKGFNQEFPFHHDDPQIVERFFRTLQRNFLEVFSPYFITARCYKKWTDAE
ncbi:class I SAM-dependent methyltransferase [Ancylothrix sp. C2]|uniref:class I SAM-dependent methyltransferase n=1 Tax=Ancylothrix sp. D3o TaxID=2953691 RepID=UPI0021BA8C11|nr:class I SAM-dependent methyltransferase [Ancylothrix sp. D3o]MCT7948939.1 class I SAM-dependent methyltransferase [Ancylothrix sp. D3o]